MDEANPNSDRYFDLSLRLLTIFVLVSLVACVAFLSYRWLDPFLRRQPDRTVQLPDPAPAPPPPAAEAAPAPADTILMDPHKAFRCVDHGKVTFSDRADRTCDTGSVQILPLNPPQPAAGGR